MTDAQFPADTFPRQQARTRHYSLGRPRSISVADDGSRVAFLRSRSGDDPVGILWVFDVDSAQERLVFGPEMEGEERISDEERDRRERLRETLTGVTAYAADRALRVAAVAIGDRLFLADLVQGGARELQPAAGPPVDPRPDPTGGRIAYVADGALRVLDVSNGDDRELASDDDPDVSWGLPEFIAADEAVSALDVSVQAQVLDLLDDVRQRFDLAMLFITHDLRVAAQICDRIMVMQHGVVVEQGRTAEVYANPRHAYTRSLLAAAPGRDVEFARA